MGLSNQRAGALRALMLSTAAGALIAGAPALALAQQATNPQEENSVLQEVVVTATRQASTVNRVPISISAATQETLDQKGVKDLADLSRNTPGLQFTRSVGGQSFDVNIRGVFSPVGAPTTAIYIDDTPIGKRGGAQTASFAAFSTPAPKLFDLDRVEVLRGPQGTLYGGSAMGGAVRFISPTPSLTTYSTYMRAEASKLKGGSEGYEAGLAVGGPIIEDKLGFRASAWFQKSPGYIDHVNMFHSGVDHVGVPGPGGQEVIMDKDSNTGAARSARLALLWKPSENLRIQPALFASYDRRDDSDQWMGKIPEYLVKGGSQSNNPNFPAFAPLAICPAGLGTTISAATIAGNCFPNQGTSSWQSYRDGPYNLGYGRSANGYYTNTSPTGGVATYARSWVQLTQPSLMIDWDLPQLSIHSSTSMVRDVSKAQQEGKFGTAGQVVATNALPAVGATGTGNCGQGPTVQNWQQFEAGCAPLFFRRGPDDTVGFPNVMSRRFAKDKRNGLFQELRLSSPGDARPFSWVAGVFFGYNKLAQWNAQWENDDQMASYIRGGTTCANFGAYTCPFLAQLVYPTTGIGGYTAYVHTRQKDTEVAGFADVSWYVTEKLRLTAGVRVSRISFDFATTAAGPHSVGLPLGFLPTAAAPFAINYAGCPDVTKGCPFTNLSSSITESPVTPKFGASYQFNETTLFYANAAKGFRPGGANASVNPAICAADFTALGITQTPLNYGSDSIWSYEGGFKARLFNAVQLNMAAYQIDWNQPQSTIILSQCGRNYIGNAGKAQVRGVDGDMTWRVTSRLTFTASASLVRGEYTERQNALGNNPAALPAFQKGEEMRNVPEFSYTLGAQYLQPVSSNMDAYIRGDLQHVGRYVRGAAFGSQGWNPITRYGEMRDFVTLRAGVKYNNVDLNLFVNNLFDDRTPTAVVYQNAVPGVFYATPNPRQVGLQVTYRN